MAKSDTRVMPRQGACPAGRRDLNNKEAVRGRANYPPMLLGQIRGMQWADGLAAKQQDSEG